jgi:hypothetical protein
MGVGIEFKSTAARPDWGASEPDVLRKLLTLRTTRWTVNVKEHLEKR